MSVCGATVRPERGLASEAGATLAQLLCQEEAESPEPRGLGIPRCRAMRNVGRISIVVVHSNDRENVGSVGRWGGGEYFSTCLVRVPLRRATARGRIRFFPYSFLLPPDS
ncbi:hypothetical protein [Okeania sp. SIO1I7]|uniref:hypothetical protein n=1 Tax=Okeania sp. SIO1I7 TaxID=2607772 RepID=UPI0013FA3B36|nr:hypothetical protein [Okeania sp. SIO1I7]NET24574.1 hypothetical protein [Okeania sp. SIO1I7]